MIKVVMEKSSQIVKTNSEIITSTSSNEYHEMDEFHLVSYWFRLIFDGLTLSVFFCFFFFYYYSFIIFIHS